MIELKEVTKRYGQAAVLKNINLSIEEPGIYHVQISAEDLAGNRSREEVIFTVKRRQSFVQNLVNPVIETVEKYTGRQTDPCCTRRCARRGRCRAG